jgi:hypothetical protein
MQLAYYPTDSGFQTLLAFGGGRQPSPILTNEINLYKNALQEHYISSKAKVEEIFSLKNIIKHRSIQGVLVESLPNFKLRYYCPTDDLRWVYRNALEEMAKKGVAYIPTIL